MKKKKIFIIIGIAILIIIIGIVGLFISNKPLTSNKSNTNNSNDTSKKVPIEETIDFPTNKGVKPSDNSNFTSLHVYENYYIDDFKLEIDSKNDTLAHAKFTLKNTNSLNYPITGIAFTFIFADGSKSNTYHTMLENDDVSVDYTLLDKVIDSVDYEFQVYQLDNNGEG